MIHHHFINLRFWKRNAGGENECFASLSMICCYQPQLKLLIKQKRRPGCRNAFKEAKENNYFFFLAAFFLAAGFFATFFFAAIIVYFGLHRWWVERVPPEFLMHKFQKHFIKLRQNCIKKKSEKYFFKLFLNNFFNNLFLPGKIISEIFFRAKYSLLYLR